MRRSLPLPALGVLTAICLACLGAAPAARADGPATPFEHLVTSWMGVVGVLGADAEAGTVDGFQIDDEAAADEERADEERRRRDQRGRGHKRHAAHGDRRHGPPPPHGMMGPGPHPGGPDMHQHAMRAFHEIIRRLARIEEKLGIEDAPPSGPRGERPGRPRPEMRGPRGPQGGAERPRRQLDIPEDVRRQMAERMEAGRRQMEEARERMENARRKLREMEERIQQLEDEVARLKGAK